MNWKIKKAFLLTISSLMFNLFIKNNVFAAVKNDTNKISPLDTFLNFVNDIFINYRIFLLIIGGVICISLLDAFYCFIVKAREQG